MSSDFSLVRLGALGARFVVLRLGSAFGFLCFFKRFVLGFGSGLLLMRCWSGMSVKINDL